ncbi:hypothetical protein [Thermococcus sp.]
MFEDLELLSLLRKPSDRALTPERRARDFLMTLRELRTGEEAELRGFLLLRRPPNAPDDGVYYVLSGLPPSELKSTRLKPYLVVKVTEKTRLKGRIRSGAYTEVSGVIQPYPWGTIKMIEALKIRARDYGDYWLEYRNFALSPREVQSLIEDTVYAEKSFQRGILYSIYGSAPLLESVTGWGEGSEFSVFGERGKESGIKDLWRVARSILLSLPEEVRLKKGKRSAIEDDFFGLDFTVFNPMQGDIRYYVPGNLLRPSRWALSLISRKKAIGLLPLPEKADVTSALSKNAETPLVFIPGEDERPYLERSYELRELSPNLMATVFLERERIGVISAFHGEGEKFRRRFERWLERKRNEYGWKFDLLTIPGSVLDLNRRYELSFRLLGSTGRFRGRVDSGAVREVVELNEEIVNDWMVVLEETPQSELQRLLDRYRGYVPSDRRAAKALEILRDLAATSPSGEVSVKAFRVELLRRGFSAEWAEGVIKSLVSEGYAYEPVAGILKLVR